MHMIIRVYIHLYYIQTWETPPTPLYTHESHADMQDVRVHIPIADVQDALSSVRASTVEALEDYANKRELHRALNASLLGFVCVWRERERGSARARVR